MCIATHRRLPVSLFRSCACAFWTFGQVSHWKLPRCSGPGSTGHIPVSLGETLSVISSLIFTCSSSVQLIWSQDEILSAYITFWSNASSLFVMSSSKQPAEIFFLMIPSFTDLLHKLIPSSSAFSQSKRKFSVPETVVLLVSSYSGIL